MGTIFTASVIAALVSAVVAIWTTQRRISIENITTERQKWRTKIREIALSIHDALIKRDEELINRLRAELRGLLNPEDEEDNAILTCVYLPEKEEELARAEEFAQRIALLLKHDWERAKLEAGSMVMRIKCVRNLIEVFYYKPERTKYKKDCECKQNSG